MIYCVFVHIDEANVYGISNPRFVIKGVYMLLTINLNYWQMVKKLNFILCPILYI